MNAEELKQAKKRDNKISLAIIFFGVIVILAYSSIFFIGLSKPGNNRYYIDDDVLLVEYNLPMTIIDYHYSYKVNQYYYECEWPESGYTRNGIFYETELREKYEKE